MFAELLAYHDGGALVLLGNRGSGKNVLVKALAEFASSARTRASHAREAHVPVHPVLGAPLRLPLHRACCRHAPPCCSASHTRTCARQRGTHDAHIPVCVRRPVHRSSPCIVRVLQALELGRARTYSKARVSQAAAKPAAASPTRDDDAEVSSTGGGGALRLHIVASGQRVYPGTSSPGRQQLSSSPPPVSLSPSSSGEDGAARGPGGSLGHEPSLDEIEHAGRQVHARAACTRTPAHVCASACPRAPC